MQNNYLSLEQAAAEYFGGNVDSVKEALVDNMGRLRLWRLIPPTNYRLAPVGYQRAAPSAEELAAWPTQSVSGWHAFPSLHSLKAISAGLAISGALEVVPGDSESCQFAYRRGAATGEYSPEKVQLSDLRLKRPEVEAFLARTPALSPAQLTEKPLGTRERASLLKIIAALAVEAKVPLDGKGTTIVEALFAQARVEDPPGEQTTRKILASAKGFLLG